MISINTNCASTEVLNIEFIAVEPLAVEIKYRSRTSPPTLPMVKTFEADMDWQAGPPAGWNTAAAFKKFLGELKLQLAADPGQNEVNPFK